MATAEILSIGTELLLGHVLDTNSQFFAQELASLGIDCYFRSTVGDNKARIKEAAKAALERADILITTGGPVCFCFHVCCFILLNQLFFISLSLVV